MTAKKTPVAPAAEQPTNTTPATAGPSTEQSASQDSSAEQADGEPADTRSEREKELEAENEQLRTELDVEIAAHAQTAADHDNLLTELEQYTNGTSLSTDESADETETTEPSEEQAIGELLTRNGLPRAWMLADGPCCDEKHARHVAGPDFGTLRVIEAQ